VDAFNSAAFASSSSSLSSLNALVINFLSCDLICEVNFPIFGSIFFCAAGKIYSLFDEVIISAVPAFGS